MRAGWILRSRWLPLDLLVQGTNALLMLTVSLAAPKLQHPTAYLALHAALAGLMCSISRQDSTGVHEHAMLKLLHDWLPTAFVLLVYFEIGVLIPLLRDFSDHHYDRILQAVDVWLVGDPLALVGRVASAPLSELLTVCYFAYYPLIVAVPLAVYVRGAREDFQQVGAIIFVAFLLTYVGYMIWPALGPHRVFDAHRPIALDGYGLSRTAYGWLRAVPSEPPDAFPSGHALLGVLVPALAWRWYRPLFAWLAPLGAGIVLATVYLRLHYLTDVVAAFILAPLAWRLGVAVCSVAPSLAARRAFEQDVPEPQATKLS